MLFQKKLHAFTSIHPPIMEQRARASKGLHLFHITIMARFLYLYLKEMHFVTRLNEETPYFHRLQKRLQPESKSCMLQC